jgi:predicted site-specific integrase-resolvase
MRRKGELSITEAAERVEVHHTTMRRWAREARAGYSSRLPCVRVDTVGRYWIPEQAVDRILTHEVDDHLEVRLCRR